MSHSKERTEKTCLNCGTSLHGRYCHVCGQENIEPRQTFWHLVSHFFYDITHFDGKFFVTLKDLILKPGFLSREYLQGRRESYLHPIRMYVFTSAIFFIIFYSLVDVKQIASTSKLNMTGKGIESFRSTALKSAKTKTDSQSVEAAYATAKKFDLPENKIPKEHVRGLKIGFEAGNLAYSSVGQYDSVQQALSPGLRDNWLQKRIVHRIIVITARSEAAKKSLLSEWFSQIIHHLGQLLFISLPIFALFLRLLYVRRKQFLYVDHAIFSIHLYIFSFITLMLFFGIEFLKDKIGWDWLWVVETLITIFAFNYYYRAMLRFYQQTKWKTSIKFVLLCILSFFMNILLIIIFSIFSLSGS